MVDTEGFITTVAGDGDCSEVSPAGTPAREASLCLTAVQATPRGNFLVVERGAQRVTEVLSAQTYALGADSDDILFTQGDGTGALFTRRGRHKATVDLATGTILREFTYDERRLLSRATDRFGSTLDIERYASGTAYALRAWPAGSSRAIVTQLDLVNNNLHGVTYPDGSGYTMAYDNGLMTDEWDPLGNHFVHTFNNRGRLIEFQDPDGGDWTYTRGLAQDGTVTSRTTSAEGDSLLFRRRRDDNGSTLITREEPSGAVSSVQTDAQGRNVVETTACGVVRQQLYGVDPLYLYRMPVEGTSTLPSGQWTRARSGVDYDDTDADGVADRITRTLRLSDSGHPVERFWRSVEDVRARVRSVTSPKGRTASERYRADLLVEEVSVPGLYPTWAEYDAYGRPTAVTVGDPAAPATWRRSSFAYDDAGNGTLRTGTAPDGASYGYVYDDLGRLGRADLPDGGRILFQYDAAGHLAQLYDQETVGQEAPFELTYTVGDRRASFVEPEWGVTRYRYDRDRRPLALAKPSAAGLSDPPAAGDWTAVNGYATGLLRWTDTPEGRISYGYAACSSKLESVSRPDPVTGSAEQVGYAYDGNLTTADARSGLVTETITYTYGERDLRPDSVTYAGVTEQVVLDDDGLLIGAGSYAVGRNALNGLAESVGDGVLAQSRTVNGYGERDGVSATVAGTPVYSWETGDPGAGQTWRDGAGRILHRRERLGTETIDWEYAYDAGGRLSEVRRNGALVEAYTYDTAGNRVLESNAWRGTENLAVFVSGAAHAVTSAAYGYRFNGDGYLEEREDAGGVTRYQYSSRGELLRVELADGRVVSYAHDPLGRRIAKLVDGMIVERYLWQGMTRLLAVYDGSGALRQRYEYADGRTPLAMTEGAARYYLLADQVGTLRAVADASGNIVKQVEYDSFGMVVADSNPGFSVPLGFAGGLHDRDTGLVRFGYRDYAPEIGRWTAKDPIDFAGGDTNLFAYVSGNPVNLVDPLGLMDNYVCVEGEIAIGPFGYDVVLGIFHDDVTGEYGLFIGNGPATGLAAGLGVGGGSATDLNGDTVNYDVNLGSTSITTTWGQTGGGAATATRGPGFGASMSITNTRKYHYRPTPPDPEWTLYP